MFEVEPLDRAPEIVEAPPSEPGDDALLARIDAVWAEERAQRGDELFNGSLFSVAGRDGGRLRGWFTEYRHWIAQLACPELAAELRIRPLAVCGFLRVEGAVLLGRRARGLTQHPGRFELAPCGAVDEDARDGAGRVSAEVQLLRELEEELGVSRERVRGLRPRLLVEDRGSHVCDLVFELELDCGQGELRRAFEQRGDGELTELRPVAPSEVGALEGDPSVSPFALAVLRALS